MAARNAAMAATTHAASDESKEDSSGTKPFKPEVRSLTLPADAPLFPPAPEDGVTDTCHILKAKIWMIFENPDCCHAALYVNLWVLGLIILSAIVACMETLPGIHKNDEWVWFGLEAFFVGNFSLEFVLRLFSCPDKGEFARSGMNWIDVISILPFYMDVLTLAATGDVDDSPFGDLSILRLARSLRLVKLFRYSSGMQMISHCLAQSSDALQLFSLIFGLLIVVCASAIYYSERGEYQEAQQMYLRSNPQTQEDEANPFESIPASLWWCVVTLTTVGYGDISPVTFTGQLVGFLTMLLGIICVAMPLSIVGSNFHEIHQGMRNGGEEEEEEDDTNNPIDKLYDIAEVSEQTETIADVGVLMCEGLSLVLRRYLEPESWYSAEELNADYSPDGELLDDDVPENSFGSPPPRRTLLQQGRDTGVLQVDERHLEALEQVITQAHMNCSNLRKQLG